MVPETSFAAEAVREQLQRIISSKAFAHSERMSRFLRLVVEYTLQHRGGELKEYLIGVEVFDRKPAFDPRLDPIVRVEARRLRAKLRKYYETDSAPGEIVIDLPTGRYTAIFSSGAPPSVEPRREAPADGAIAVLPFANLSTEDETDYFSDGLAQELIHGLTRVEGLRVVAWNSASILRGQTADLRAIQTRLNVNAILTGSVRKAGSRVRISVQLIDTSSDLYLWSETYDRDLHDLLEIQEQISRSIVAELRVNLADHRSFSAVRKATWNFEAHNLYLQGRFHWNKRTIEGLTRSVQCFEQALAIDNGLALAWAGLADSYNLLADNGLRSPDEAMPRAKDAALKALERDPTLAEAWTSLALIQSSYEWNWEEAGASYAKALQLNPGYATLHHWYGVDYLSVLGRFDEAFREVAIARQLDPCSAITVESHAFLYLLARRYDEAMRKHQEAMELDPHLFKPWTSMGRLLIQMGRFEEAIQMLEKGRSLAGDIPNLIGALGQAHALAGRPERARELLRELEAASRQRYVPLTSSAVIHIGLGEKSEALDLLERACERRELPLVVLNVHPVWDSLREEPRFDRLLRRLRLVVS